jgi:hypothetical protein
MTSTLHARFESSGCLPVGTPEDLVYAVPVDNEAALHHCTVDSCQIICNYPGISERMWWSMMRHIEAGIQSHRGYSEYSLQMHSFSYNSQIKRFQTHVDMDIFSGFDTWNSCPKFVHTFQLHLTYCTTYSFHLIHPKDSDCNVTPKH